MLGKVQTVDGQMPHGSCSMTESTKGDIDLLEVCDLNTKP